MANNYNPDVLNCIANLSNDEVFTPPALANQVLDLLPQSLFESTATTFLDPFTKSGVFLREIVKRLDRGLMGKIPDRQERIDHILHKQVFGIACTELTSLLARRSVYCSKHADGKYSVSPFQTDDGNILYTPIKHTWRNGKCKYCGASQQSYDRADEYEQYAYQFIHTDTPQSIFHMQFDVVCGNPPYQLSTAGDDNGAQAKPLYHLFVEQAIKLNPRFVLMITPSRWFSGGWGLDEFRNKMLVSNHFKEIHDFQDSSECFTGVDIKGGVSYFLYQLDYVGKCRFVSHDGKNTSETFRFLKEKGCEMLIRFNEIIPIYQKVLSAGDFVQFSTIVSPRSPFGLNTNHFGTKEKKQSSDIKYFERTGYSYMERDRITRCTDWINQYKLYVPKTAEDGKLPGKVIGNITIGEPGTICSGTYLVVGPFKNEIEAKNVQSYMKTKLFRLLVAINKISQDAYGKVYDSVPLLSFSHPWTDEMLYKKYGITDDEISFIDSMIRPME